MKQDSILFIDIETVSQYKKFNAASDEVKHIWQKKYEKNDYLKSLNIEEAYETKAAIFAEYGKIICISVGYYHSTKDEFRIKSFAGDVEKKLLEEFKNFCLLLKKNYVFCGHNIKEFDIPYLCRRFLINRISIPSLLDFQDKKPWEIELLDTLQLWKFGDYKNYTSLETLTTIFNIPTPKDDISGADVSRVYYEENDLERIKDYCEKDVIALIQLFLRMRNEPLVKVTEK